MSVNVPQGVIDNILTRLAAVEQATAGASAGEELTPNYLKLNPNGGVGLDSRYLATANNLSDVPNPALAIDNLGALDAAENLSDIPNPTSALQHLGIGWEARAYLTAAATSPAGTYPQFVQIPLDTVDFDPTGRFTTVGIGLAYQVAVSGIYIFAASAQVVLRGSIQPQWILSVNNGLGEGSRGMATIDFTGSTGVTMTGNLGLVAFDIRPLSVGQLIYPAIYAPYQFTYQAVGALSNMIAVSRIA